MPQAEPFPALNHITAIEELRDSRVLVLAASTLEIELLPALYQQCRDIGHTRRLDVVLQSRGGVVNGARRLALLLRQFTHHLSFIVPHYCESSATLMVLAADEIIAGDLAIFSPIDPQLHGGAGGDGDSMLSCLDIRRFGDMSKDWFGAESAQAQEQALSLLCGSIFPPTLTAFYRSAQEVEQIARELLRHQFPGQDDAKRKAVVQQLMYGYHSHNYAITGGELERMGLKVRRHEAVEDHAWQISQGLHALVGRGVCETPDQPWHDALLATRDGARVRNKRSGGFVSPWRELGAEAE